MDQGEQQEEADKVSFKTLLVTLGILSSPLLLPLLLSEPHQDSPAVVWTGDSSFVGGVRHGRSLLQREILCEGLMLTTQSDQERATSSSTFSSTSSSLNL